MAHEFTKYDLMGGAYHWDPVKAGPDYMAHAEDVAKWITESPVLDIGGGDGYICSRIRATDRDCMVVDNLPYAVQLANMKGQPAIVGDIMDLPKTVTWRRWGAIYLGDIIEHLDNQAAAILACGALTDIIYIATPPVGTKGSYHTHEFSPEELEKFMLNLGWIQTRAQVKHCRIFARYEKTT